MRLLTDTNNAAHARTFVDVALSHGVEIEARQDGERYELWVVDEEDMSQAKTLWQDFRANPEHPKYAHASTVARNVRKEQAKAEQENRNRHVDVRTQVFYNARSPFGHITMGLIGICVVLTLVTDFGDNHRIWQWLSIVPYTVRGGYIYFDTLPNVLQQGQLWRLLTPVFAHGGVMHLVFNMLWLLDLGSTLESKRGVRFLLLMLVVTGVASNVGQYLWSGPNFLGMSGVIYAMLGYVWFKSRHDPSSQMNISPGTMTFMVIWFFICWLGWMGPVANLAHTVGLVGGLAWAFLTTPGAWRRLLR